MGKFTGLKPITDSEPRQRAPEEPKRKVSKRDNPDYTQISLWVPKAPYIEIRRRLLGTGRDFSDLAAEWMQKWLNGNCENV